MLSIILNSIDVEKNGNDNAGFKNSTTTIDQATKPQIEEEKVDEKTLAENEKKAAEGCHEQKLRNYVFQRHY